MNTTMSAHFQNDRADRYAFIATKIGLGEVVHTHKQKYNKWGSEPCTVSITTTGVAIVKAPDGKIVTMYILTLSEAQKYFNSAIPMILAGVIRMNMKRRLHILQDKMKF